MSGQDKLYTSAQAHAPVSFFKDTFDFKPDTGNYRFCTNHVLIVWLLSKRGLYYYCHNIVHRSDIITNTTYLYFDGYSVNKLQITNFLFDGLFATVVACTASAVKIGFDEAENANNMTITQDR
ncbi:hypothetical protein QTP88_014790 [Uroleucon formosanum]